MDLDGEDFFPFISSCVLALHTHSAPGTSLALVSRDELGRPARSEPVGTATDIVVHAANNNKDAQK